MATFIYKNNFCLQHASDISHPEHADRIKLILSELQKPEYKNLTFIDAEKANKDLLLLAHDQEYINQLENVIPEIEDTVYLDPNTLANKYTYDASLYSVGMVQQAVDDVLLGKTDNAFCLTRPPGHHAKREILGGFCVVNNIAIGTIYALQQKDINKIAIIDFDVHHGNGTQNIFWNDPRVLFASVHQKNIFPMEGYEDETGEHNNIINVTLNDGAGEIETINILQNIIFPAVRNHKPDILFVSAGFDSHRLDPLAGINMDTESYNKLGVMLKDLAQELCKGRLISTLAGGYNLEVLGQSVGEYIKGIQ